MNRKRRILLGWMIFVIGGPGTSLFWYIYSSKILLCIIVVNLGIILTTLLILFFWVPADYDPFTSITSIICKKRSKKPLAK